MAAIQEIKVHPGNSESVPHVHISVDGREYLILGGKGYVTVIAGRLWIGNVQRALGKTFWSAADLLKNYKKDGNIVLEYANRLCIFAR